MKKRILPYGFISLLIAGIAVVFLISATEDRIIVPEKGNSGANGIEKAKEYLATLRNNQVTGVLNPGDEIRAGLQVAERATLKSSSGENLDWIEMGPNNLGGRTRAVLFDNRDPNGKTLYAASVTGGLFKTTNFGAYWEKVNTGENCLYVSCMIQDDNGTIYLGTGEGLEVQKYSMFGEIGYTGGFVGSGIYKSTDGETFTRVAGTQPDPNDENADWAYINEIALDKNGKLWAATNTGLKTQTNDGWVLAEYTDTANNVVQLSGLAYDVKTGKNGVVIAAVDGKVFVSQDANSSGFVCVSYGLENQLPSEGVSRIELAIAPSDENVIYAVATNSVNNSLYNVYMSEDGGMNWTIVGPGGSDELNILGSTFTYVDNDNLLQEETYYQGDYDNTIVVFPNNPYKILAGGIDLWIGYKTNPTGYFYWEKKSTGTDIDIFSSEYVHNDQHVYFFNPNNPNQFVIGTDGGVFLCNISGNNFQFQNMNKGYNVAQFYSIGISAEVDVVAGGVQDNGTLLLDGNSSTPERGIAVWNDGDFNMPTGGDGGACLISNIYYRKTGEETTPPAMFYSKAPLPNMVLKAQFRRSETMGFDYSSKYLNSDMTSSAFYTPSVLWECYSDANSRDSVDFVAYDDYEAGDKVIVRSSNYKYPFDYYLPVAMNKFDTLRVQDIISTKLFFGMADNIWMTKQALRFDVNPEWFLISDKDHTGMDGTPQCLAYSADANYLWVGTVEGSLYRISNIAYAYNYDLADVNSPDCIIATDLINFKDGNTQVITSVSVDPLDPNKVLVTLGNYGNEDYVYFTSNALSDEPVFTSVQGDLPEMPVYSSILEFHSGDMAIIGTEKGIWVTDDVTSGQWYQSSSAMDNVPVMALKQQYLYRNTFTVVHTDPGTGQNTYETYPGIENTGMIYAATYGRGIFRCENFHEVGYDENIDNGSLVNSVSVYPNPVVANATVAFDLKSTSDINISIFNIQGKLVKTLSKENVIAGHNTIDINMNDLNNGTYIIKLSNGSKSAISKFIIFK